MTVLVRMHGSSPHRDAACAWLRDHGIDPHRVSDEGVRVDGDQVTVHIVEFASFNHTVLRELTVTAKTPFPVPEED